MRRLELVLAQMERQFARIISLHVTTGLLNIAGGQYSCGAVKPSLPRVVCIVASWHESALRRFC